MSNEKSIENIEEILEKAARAEMPEEIKLQSDDQANWIARKLSKICKQEAELASIYDDSIKDLEEEISTIKARKEEAVSPYKKQEEYLKNSLIEYHKLRLSHSPKDKTVKLPYATLKSRARQPEYVRDEEKLLDWAKKNNLEFVKKEESIKWAEMKAALAVMDGKAVYKETGEVIDGIEIVKREPKFEIEV